MTYDSTIGTPQAIVLSAASDARLRALARRLRDRLAQAPAGPEDGRPGPSGPDELAGIAYTLQTGRTAMRCRLAVVGTELPGVLEGLDAFLEGRGHPGLTTGRADEEGGARAVADTGSFTEAAHAWVTGTRVDWSGYWPEPPARISLPTSPWEDDEDPAEARTPASPEATRAAGPAATDGSAVREAALHWLVEQYAEVSGLPRSGLHPHVPLDEYGLSSFLITRLNERLERMTGDTDRTLFFVHRDLAGVADELARRHPERWMPPHRGSVVPAVLDAGDAPGTGGEEAVAVIGIAGRYPLASNVDTLWRNLVNGTDCVTSLPESRMHPGWPSDLMHGGFLDSVDTFDPLLFGVTPRDAALMDPQERLYLEVVWEALEDAGYPRSRLRARHGSNVAVYAGAMYNEYPYYGVESTLRGQPLDSGATLGGIANRVSYHFDLHGPSLTVDTMCSSSLVAIDLALRALRSGGAEVALAGAVNLSLHPNKFRQQQRMRLSAEGRRCRSFGARGDGFVPAEGAGVVVLKPLRRALADGDRIHAVLRGSAVVHAGRTNGYLVPDPAAQARMVAQALDEAGVESRTIGFIEAHGAGTALGDPVEIAGLTRVFGDLGLAPGAIPIGSVKSNMGHVEPAAGIAGLTKVILQMRHRRFAPSLHAEELNANIDWSSVPFRVQRTAEEWPETEHPRRAGISSFGAGGTIAHLVVEEAPRSATGTAGPPPRPGPHLVVVSAHDDERLRLVARRLAHALSETSEHPAPALQDIAHTSQVGREPLRRRLAVVADDVDGLRVRLEGFAEGVGGPAGADPDVVQGHAPGAGSEGELSAVPTAVGRTELRELAHHWCRGGRIDWDQLHTRTGRRPRIVPLPTYPFARMRCWVPEPDPESAPEPVGNDGKAGPAPRGTLPQGSGAGNADVPLYVRDWSPAGPVGEPAFPDAPLVCVFAGPTEALAQSLASHIGAERVLLVREGSELGDGIPGYVTESDAEALAQSLLDRHAVLDGWLDLADLHRPEAERGLWRPRLAMLRRIVADRAGAGLRVLQVTAGLQDLAGPEPSLSGALTAAFVRVLGAEHRRLVSRVLDTDLRPGEEAELTRSILAEWASDEPVGEVCHRSGTRHLPVLRAVEAPAEPLSLDPDATYLITGGTRGIGARVARFFADRGARNLVLCGLHPIPERDSSSVAPERAEAAATVHALRDGGVRVLVHDGPLTDRPSLERLLDRARRTLGPIGGVVHCAGRPSQEIDGFVYQRLDRTAEVLEPKADGVRTLLDAVAEDAPRFVLLYSSVCAAVPSLAAGVVDYAAANGFLDFVAAYRSRTGQPWTGSVNWPQWSESGGTRDLPNPCLPVGLGALTDTAGLRTLERVLALPSGSRVLPAPPLDGPVDPDELIRLRRAPTLPPGPRPEPASPDRPWTAGTAEGPQSPPAWLIDIFARTLRIPADALDTGASFSDLGVESIMLGELLRAVEEELGRPLHPAVLLEHPTLDELSAHLGVAEAPPPPVRPTAAEPVRAPATARATTPSTDERIAVVGMATRFPGAPDLESFWAGLLAERDAVTEVPASRWNVERYYSPRPEPGRSISKWGGFIDGIEEFDAGYFGFDDVAATRLDPAIRMFLEGTATCLREAGYADGELAGQEIGVFAGARMSDYADRAGIWSGGLRSDQNFIAAHVAHHFDFRGPNLVVDSACSSSLVSVQLAVRSLLAGESSMALAGGVEVLLDHKPYLELSAARALSPSGRCATFDERADGFVPAEGCGVVLLKPLGAALADGDRIHAVIESVAVNNDGRTMGVTTPNPSAQVRVVRRALELAGRHPEEIGMLEAHGTGTLIGDPIELRALTEAFGGKGRTGRCAIGSVKSNLGHLMSGAGIAGLAKVVLALEHGVIPATIGCERPNPRFDFGSSPFHPHTRTSAWPGTAVERVAGLSSFGLGGTNAHLVAAALDPRLREGRPAPRQPLPPPRFQRSRLWLDAPPEDPAPVTEAVTRAASFLDLELTVDGAPAAIGRTAG